MSLKAGAITVLIMHVKENNMEFDISRVYSSVNADKLKLESKVIIGDTIEALRNKQSHGRETSGLYNHTFNCNADCYENL